MCLMQAQRFRGNAFLQLLLSTCCVFVRLQVSLHKQAQGSVIKNCSAVVLQLWLWSIAVFCTAEYASAGVHVLAVPHALLPLGNFHLRPHMYSFPVMFLSPSFLQRYFLS